MKTVFKRLLVSVFWLYAVQGESAELLGGISDETAQVPAQEHAGADDKGRIIYRVICPADGEALPECGQPPVDDFFEAAQPQQAEPEQTEAPATAEGQEKQLEQTVRNSPQSGAVEPVAVKKVAVHKKHSRKPAKKAHKRRKR